MRQTLSRLGLMVVKLFSCSIQLSMKFQLLIRTKMLKTKIFLALNLSDGVLILLKIVSILTFMTDKFYAQMSMKNVLKPRYLYHLSMNSERSVLPALY